MLTIFFPDVRILQVILDYVKDESAIAAFRPLDIITYIEFNWQFC
jgi:hypothetical protein